MNKQYICHSGGCNGSDMMWESEVLKYGSQTISYSFSNHKLVTGMNAICDVIKHNFYEN